MTRQVVPGQTWPRPYNAFSNTRALDGQHPTKPEEIIAWFEAVAKAWNRAPTPFEGCGKRAGRRARSRQRRHALGGSGAHTRRPVRQPRQTTFEKWRHTCQVTH